MSEITTIQYIENLKARVAELEEAIRKHRDATGHNLCWLNNKELYTILHESEVDNRDTLPPKGEFLNECEKYYEELKKNV